MLRIPSPTKFVPRRGRAKAQPAPAAMALTLTAATFDATGPRVELTFDRAVNGTGVDVGQFQLYDGVTTLRRYIGSGVLTQIEPQILRISLEEQAAIGAGNVSLTVGAENGVVARDDAGKWDGVSDLGLPYSAT